MDVSSYKRAAVCAMTQFGNSDLHEPTESQVAAVEDYFEATHANSCNELRSSQERYMAGLRIVGRCVKAMTRQRLAKVYLWLDMIACKEHQKRPKFRP